MRAFVAAVFFSLTTLGMAPIAQALDLDYVTLVASPSSVNFYDVQVGQGTQTQYVYLYNQGTEDAKSIYVSAACDSSFYVNNSCYGDLRPQSSCSINIQFHPYSPGFHSCSVNVSTISGGSASINVQGSAHQ
jgi:hypothetical protein